MLTLPPGARVFVATERVDGRKGIDGLSALIRSGFAEDPLSGTMFVFFSRRADRVRVLYWDRDGYVLVTKRLEKGSYRVPWRAEQGRVVIEAAELLLVLDFGSIDHDKLMKLVERRVSDRRVLKLLRQWLTVGVMVDGVKENPTRGTPQGGVISPLLSNIYLAVLDDVWTKRCAHLGELVRYCDDFVVMCKTKRDVDEAELRVKHVMTRLGLELHPDKTRKVELSLGKEGFDFLGCHLRKRMSGTIWEREHRRVYFLQRWPSSRAMNRIRQRVKDLTPRSRCHAELRDVVARLNPVLRGWGEYFRTGNADVKFNRLDEYVYERLRALRLKRAGSKLKAGQAERWTRDYFVNGFGLYRLRGTIRYPEAA